MILDPCSVYNTHALLSCPVGGPFNPLQLLGSFLLRFGEGLPYMEDKVSTLQGKREQQFPSIKGRKGHGKEAAGLQDHVHFLRTRQICVPPWQQNMMNWGGLQL